MFFVPLMIAASVEQAELARLENQRFDALAPDKQQLELRKREVKALERMARAQEESNNIRHRRYF